MQNQATAAPSVSKRHEYASEDQWLVQCLTLAAFAAMAYSQLLGENVFLALM